MIERTIRPAREFALLALLALLWGSTYFFLKIAVSEIPPVTVIAARVSIAAVFLLAVLRLRGERLPADAGTWRRLFLLSLLNSTIAWTLLAWGQQHIDSSLASVLNSTSPIFVFLFTLVISRHESTSPMRFLGACLGLVGVVLIVGTEALAGLGREVAGQAAAVTGAMLYAGAAIYGRSFRHLSAPATAAGTMLCAAFCLVPLSLALDAPWRLAPSGRALLAVGVLSVFCTGVAVMLYFRLVHTLGSLGVASQAYLRAVVGVLLGTLLLGEHLPLLVVMGSATAILGVVLINLPAWRGRGVVSPVFVRKGQRER
ncbi:MAG: EamA family transporter [Shinella sp.]|nr:EamA family transporter [Shinella sp.]